MKSVPLLLACLLGAGSGCVAKSTARQQNRDAFAAGQRSALARAEQPATPTVTVLGEVRNRWVAWNEELTLAQAILAAEFTGVVQPFWVYLRRNGGEVRIQIRKLLAGSENPRLEPGDVVEVR